MSRIDQVNELLREEIANYINRDLDLEGMLVTVSYVDCSPDLHYADIGISVLPDKFTGTAVSSLRKYTSAISRNLLRKTKLHHIPKLVWKVDMTERDAAEIEDFINKNISSNKF